MRDLEELLRDSSAARPLTEGDLKVEQIAYDFTEERDEYRLGKNDVLDIFVVGHPEISSQRIELGQIAGTTIRKDGKVHLPIVGEIQAEGLTVIEFEEKFREIASQYVVDPQVHVEILRHESQKYYVLGEVPKPGTYPVDGDTTLIEAIGIAGGIPPTADVEGAVVVRNGKLLPISLGDMLKRGDMSRNVFMRHGDVVFVPDNANKKVFVLGEVKKPTVVQIEKDAISLAHALAVAGGPTPARARRELAVIRGGFAKPIVYIIDLDKAMLVDDMIKLRSGDRIVVAPTGLSTASRYMEQLLPFFRGLQAAGLTASGAANTAQTAAVISQPE